MNSRLNLRKPNRPTYNTYLDKVTGEHLMYGGSHIVVHLTLLFNSMLRHCLGQFKRLLKTYLFGGWDRGAL